MISLLLIVLSILSQYLVSTPLWLPFLVVK